MIFYNSKWKVIYTIFIKMKSNILRENMKRFGTKNLSEQKDELETAAEPVAPKAEEKVDVEKTFIFKGNKGITSSGKPFTNPPYSVDFQIVSRLYHKC